MVAGQKAGPPPNEGKEWESRTSGETIPFVWIPSLKIWAGKTEVTVAQFRKFKALPGPTPEDGQLPVTGMTYDEAYDYGEWLSKAERAGKGLPDGWRVRLPTEEEWTALAACGQRRDYPWGPSWPPKSGNYGVVAGPKFLFFGKRLCTTTAWKAWSVWTTAAPTNGDCWAWAATPGRPAGSTHHRPWIERLARGLPRQQCQNPSAHRRPQPDRRGRARPLPGGFRLVMSK